MYIYLFINSFIIIAVQLGIGVKNISDQANEAHDYKRVNVREEYNIYCIINSLTVICICTVYVCCISSLSYYIVCQSCSCQLASVVLYILCDNMVWIQAYQRNKKTCWMWIRMEKCCEYLQWWGLCPCWETRL